MSPEYNFHLKKTFNDDSGAIQFRESLRSIIGLDIVITRKIESLPQTTSSSVSLIEDSRVTTQEASRMKNVSTARIKQIIAAGIIPGRKLGNTWLIQRQNLDQWTPPGRGRPTRRTSNS